MELSAQAIEILAAACHSAWYAYSVLALGEAGQEWEQAPEWQRESIRSAVRFWAFNRGREDLERVSHENWMRERLASGWRLGPVRDAEARTSPCLVPYDELPEPQRRKDLVVVQAFRAVFREMSRT